MEGRLRILLVHDSVGRSTLLPLLREALPHTEVVEHTAGSAGPYAAWVATGSAGRGEARPAGNAGDRIDCVVLDGSGLEGPRPGAPGEGLLQERTRELGRDAPCVLVLRHADDAASMTARWAGASDVVALDTLSAKKLAHSISNAVRVHRAESETARAQARLARYAAQLKGLAETSLEVVGQKSADQLLITLATRARELVGTHIATVRLLADGRRSLPPQAVSLSDEYAAARGSSRERRGLEAPAPLNGWIAAPLVQRDGHTSGLVELADKYHGEFDEHDEAVLIQLAQLGSVALENVGLLEREQAARQLAEQSAWLAEENAERVGRLHRVSVGLAAALSVTDVAREIVRLACPAALAERAALYLAPPERERLVNLAEQRGSATSLPWPAGFGVSDPGPVPRAFRNGRACYLRAWRPRQPQVRNARAQHASAFVILPLRSRGEAATGVLVLGFAERREFHGADRVFLESLAEHCAQALERARLYEAERYAREQAEAASRLKDEFLATVSHELRTPLQSIWGWSRLLVNDAGAAPRVAKGIQVIERNARSLAHLVDDILDVSRVITGKLRVVPRPMQLDEVVYAAAETLRVAAEAKRIELSVRVETGAGALSGDPDRLQQVVWNLVANAIKFTPPGGNVEVALTRSEGAVVLAVSDDGMGIAPEFLPCVFDRFRQADGTSTRAHGGLGLGLSLVRHLVELHGGHVRAHSPGLGRGATFTVVLPILEAVLPLDARQPSGVNDGAAPAGALVGVRVVAVDDEEDTLEFIRTTLERQGACVVTANCAEDALVFVSTLIPDVLVLDLMLPDLDGCALLEHLRGLPDGGVRGVPAVAVTAQVRAEDRARALAAGFQRCLSKPFGPRELVDNVRELAEAERTARAPLVSGLRHAPPGPPPLRDTETAEGDAVNHAPAGARAPVKAGA